MKIIAAFAVGFALAGALSAAPAQAQNARSFVSGHGSDSNNCSLTAPCRSFAAAFAVTNASGEIDILDPAGYGVLTITKAISIVNDGVGTSSVLVPSGGIGITISAGVSDAVHLRGLTIDGEGAGQTGIQFNSGQSLTIVNCIIRHMTADGIDFLSTTATAALTVSNSLVADNVGLGISFVPTGSATAVFNHVEANNNGGAGFAVYGTSSAGTNTVNATVSESVAAGNGQAGFFSNTNSGNAPTSLMIFHSVAANNGYGVFAIATGATIRLANSTVTGNTVGWDAVASGILDSYGENYIDGNGTGETAPPSISQQ